MAIFMILFIGIVFTALSLTYRVNLEPVDKSSEELIEVTIPTGMNAKQVGKLLEEKGLIRNSGFFTLYLKLFNKGNFKASTYELSKSMDLETIVDLLEKGNDLNHKEVRITFKEGINFRKLAKLIADNTSNTEEDVYDVLKDEEYIDSLIDNYWFITVDIKDKNIYYSLEGYLYPDTYNFYEDSSAKDIINKLLDKMKEVLEPYKNDIRNSKYSVHEILTLASIAEKEVEKTSDRKDVVSVFINRLNKKMSLGSDITTRYGIKLDDGRPLTKAEYDDVNPYNTRRIDFIGLPAGPISMVSKASIEAAINPNETNYLYFISNIETKETFFFENYNDFSKKKSELASINNGY